MTAPVTRKELRHRTRDALVAVDVASGNVAASRLRPLRDDGTTAVLVYTTRESGNATSPELGPPAFATTIDLVIDALAEAPNNDETIDDEQELDDLLDDLADIILTATLENAEWLDGIEGIPSLEITKHPAGPDGKLILGGLRVAMQVSVGTVIYTPNLTDAFKVAGGKPLTVAGATRQFGVDIDGDGTADIQFEDDIPQN